MDRVNKIYDCPWLLSNYISQHPPLSRAMRCDVEPGRSAQFRNQKYLCENLRFKFRFFTFVCCNILWSIHPWRVIVPISLHNKNRYDRIWICPYDVFRDRWKSWNNSRHQWEGVCLCMIRHNLSSFADYKFISVLTFCEKAKACSLFHQASKQEFIMSRNFCLQLDLRENPHEILRWRIVEVETCWSNWQTDERECMYLLSWETAHKRP